MKTSTMFLLLTAVLLVAMNAAAQPSSSDALARGFSQPPPSAKPWVYWFWLDGNITREGITADLEAMARTGIGGALIMEVAQGIPPGPVRFASPEWREVFKHAVSEAHRLGLEINMNDDAGWCGSGGPWITPDRAMQKVVWTETRVDGPAHFEAALEQPPTAENYLRDIAVLAFPTPPEELQTMLARAPKVTCSASAVSESERAALIDERPDTRLRLPKPAPGQPQWVAFEFATPVAGRGVGLTLPPEQRRVHAEVQISGDGVDFKTVGAFDFSPANAWMPVPLMAAPHWRLMFTQTDSGADALEIIEAEIGVKLRIGSIAGKSARVVQFVGWPEAPQEPSADLSVKAKSIVDLSGQFKDGKLTWDAPEGNWTVLRLAYTPTGARNAPAAPDATGLECDKLAKEGIEAQFEGLIKKLVADSGPLAGQPGAGLTMTHIDSWEVGSQNWTARFREEFQTRRGYDPLPWMVSLTGRAVQEIEVTERFLWDYRRTVGELLADNYAGHLRELCHQHGLQLSIEAYGDCVFDNLVYAGRADMPMSEFWIGGGAMALGKAMSSAAHTYGRPIMAAESFTAADTVGKWMHHPFSLKPLGDQAFCEGVNRFVFHRFAMQPWLDRAPGMTMGPWGVHYERTETWWEQSKPWHEYLARCQYLLQAGRFHADVCYLMTEGSPNDAPARQSLAPALPAEYDYDVCTAEMAMQLQVQDGEVTLPSGMRYKVLCLANTNRMTPEMARKIQSLVEAGAIVAGPPPQFSPSLADYPKCDEAVRQFAATCWESDNRLESLGHGKILRGEASLERVMKRLNLPPDFVSRPNLRYLHRVADDTDLYFVANPLPNAVEATAAFRVAGRPPELWHPESGRIEQVAIYDEKDGVTRLPLRLEPYASIFVVFRRGTVDSSRVISITRDGAPILPRIEFGPAFKVQKAVYGVPGEPGKIRDVRELVQARVDAGERTLSVSGFAQSGDPAPGAVKTLTIEYTAGKEAISVHGEDPETLNLPDYAPSIVVEKAEYGVPGDPARTRDVRERVQRLADTGKLSFPVTDLAADGDPAVNVVKTVTIEYTLGGEKTKVSGTDAETLSLAAPPSVHAEHILDAMRSAEGQTAIEAWQAGTYEIRTADGKSGTLDVPALPAPIEIDGAWNVTFPPGLGAPAKATFEKLMPWNEHADAGIKYFSGTAVYRKTFQLPAEWIRPEAGLYLDLGEIRVIADVMLNGKPLGTLWAPPFRVNIAEVAHAGENTLEVAVTNLWVNRLIGDEQLPEDSERNPEGNLKAWPKWLLDNQPSPTGRIAFSTWRLWKKDDALSPSGWIGPARILATAKLAVPQ